MVAAFHPKLLTFLNCLHSSRRAAGIEELARSPPWPATRSIYRWHHDLGDRLIYFPSVTYEAFGLTHVHLFIDDPRDPWLSLPYAIRARWVVRHAGIRTIHIHCLVPTAHLSDFRALLTDDMHVFESTDGWQVLGDLTSLATPMGELPRTTPVAATDLVERYPLLVPVICAAAEKRCSLDDLWRDLHARLGSRVWEFLPRGVRRTPHNGKQYVQQSLRLLNEAFLFRQHVVRYQPLDDVTVELVLLVRAQRLSDVLQVLADAPLVEVYPGGEQLLVNVTCGLRSLSAIFSADTKLAISDCFFVDRTRNQSAPVQARFAYELLFDPCTCEWIFPHEQLSASR
jgi:hypothetical protein